MRASFFVRPIRLGNISLSVWWMLVTTKWLITWAAALERLGRAVEGRGRRLSTAAERRLLRFYIDKVDEQ